MVGASVFFGRPIRVLRLGESPELIGYLEAMGGAEPTLGLAPVPLLVACGAGPVDGNEIDKGTRPRHAFEGSTVTRRVRFAQGA